MKALTNKSNEDRLLRFMDTEKGKAIFDSFVKNECTASISGILSPLTGNAAEVVERFHNKLFDLQGNPTPELRNILNLGITLTNLSNILNKARVRAPRAFEELYNVLFDNEGRNTCCRSIQRIL
ncbi:hypothetical protein [Wolbachia endosymbiont (group A) of Ennomos erosarius]|uniref:hypothetical protein n=1 Tax=Wolbachia endosymbiont (group A) of Ennomos erosarius TaxID=3066174 RepID=UPI00334174F1